jgi:hypothetical protein
MQVQAHWQAGWRPCRTAADHHCRSHRAGSLPAADAASTTTTSPAYALSPCAHPTSPAHPPFRTCHMGAHTFGSLASEHRPGVAAAGPFLRVTSAANEGSEARWLEHQAPHPALEADPWVARRRRLVAGCGSRGCGRLRCRRRNGQRLTDTAGSSSRSAMQACHMCVCGTGLRSCKRKGTWTSF